MLEQLRYNMTNLLSHIHWPTLLLCLLSLTVIIVIGLKGARFTKRAMLALGRRLPAKHQQLTRRIMLSITFCVHMALTLFLLSLWCDKYLFNFNTNLYVFTEKVLLTLGELIFFVSIYDVIKCCHLYQIEKLNKPVAHIAPLVADLDETTREILENNNISVLESSAPVGTNEFFDGAEYGKGGDIALADDITDADVDAAVSAVTVTGSTAANAGGADAAVTENEISNGDSVGNNDTEYDHKIRNSLYRFVQNQSFLNYSAIGANILIFTVATISILSIWVSNINGLIAGLSLGGLAFSLAAKDAAANLFGSIAIMLDRPFEVGDWISVNNIEGTIIKVGIRSTRIKAIDETIFTIPNSILAQSPVNTAGKREKRRVVLNFGFTYSSTREQLEQFCKLYTMWLAASNLHNLSTLAVHLDKFSDSSIDVVARFYTVADFNLMCKAKQDAYFTAMRLAKELNLDFAFPSVSVYNANIAVADDTVVANDTDVADDADVADDTDVADDAAAANYTFVADNTAAVNDTTAHKGDAA